MRGEAAGRSTTEAGGPGGGAALDERRSLVSGVLLGIGIAAFLDEAVFHQILHWHHFYDRSTPTAGLVSDGLFHAFGWLCTVAGLYLPADLRRRDAFSAVRWRMGVLIGLGGFQLWDGLVQHKWWRLHEIRYGVTIWPYDLAWNAAAGVVLLTGTLLLLRTRQGRGGG